MIRAIVQNGLLRQLDPLHATGPRVASSSSKTPSLPFPMISTSGMRNSIAWNWLE